MYRIQHRHLTDKLKKPPYQIRSLLNRRLTIIIHSTNGRKDSKFESELKYLSTTSKVSAHYLISKQGDIVEILPVTYQAFHAGAVSHDKWSNINSIGIECHYTPGEDKNLPDMIRSLTSLCRHLMGAYKIPTLDIEMHRTVAIPKGRKQDPSFFTDEEFYSWRSSLLRKKVVVKSGVLIYTASDHTSKVADHITIEGIEKGRFTEDKEVDVLFIDPYWAWITTGIGFIHKDGVKHS